MNVRARLHALQGLLDRFNKIMTLKHNAFPGSSQRSASSVEAATFSSVVLYFVLFTDPQGSVFHLLAVLQLVDIVLKV